MKTSVTKTASQDDVLNDDSDPESDSFSVTHIKRWWKNSAVSSGIIIAMALHNRNIWNISHRCRCSYTYTADQDAADDLDANDTAPDTFTITDDHGATDTADLVFTVTGVNDDPVTVNDTDTVTADQSVSKSASQDDVMNDDSDPDDDDTFTVTHIKKYGAPQTPLLVQVPLMLTEHLLQVHMVFLQLEQTVLILITQIMQTHWLMELKAQIHLSIQLLIAKGALPLQI